MPRTAAPTAEDRHLLLRLQRRALQYFLDNQTSGGLVLDRQSNRGPLRSHGLCSTAATGMGWIALALAAAPPYLLLGRAEAARRVRAGLETALELPHDRGVMPHFVHSRTLLPHGADHLSTIDSAWLAAGALWAASALGDGPLAELAERLYGRIDWDYWAGPDSPLLRHGQARDGRFLTCRWDRLNGETVFMYVLAAGAEGGRALSPWAWRRLAPFYGTVAGLRFNNADLGLFVFQYGLDLLDLAGCRGPGGVDLAAEAAVAAEANHRFCRDLAGRFATFRDYWGLSAGDGPAGPPEGWAYRCYAPAGPVDGTAHLTATLASVGHRPELVLDNLRRAGGDRRLPLLGRYGLSSVNLDQRWFGPDMVGIDAGAAVLALDNYLAGDRVRRVFGALPCVRRGLERAGFRHPDVAPARAA